jgi:hypothetical protein
VNKFRTRHVALVMSIAAVAVAGCGSSSKSKTSGPAASTPATPSTTSSTSTTALPSSAKQQAQAAVTPFLAAVQQLKQNPQSAKDPATYTKLASTLRTAASKLGTISVPATDKAKLNQAVSLINGAASTADKLATDLKNKDQAAFKSDLQKFESIGSQLESL